MTTATSIQTKLYIDGKWCDALDGKTHAVINPATEEVLWEVAYGSRAETKLALEAGLPQGSVNAAISKLLKDGHLLQSATGALKLA